MLDLGTLGREDFDNLAIRLSHHRGGARRHHYRIRFDFVGHRKKQGSNQHDQRRHDPGENPPPAAVIPGSEDPSGRRGERPQRNGVKVCGGIERLGQLASAPAQGVTRYGQFLRHLVPTPQQKHRR